MRMASGCRRRREQQMASRRQVHQRSVVTERSALAGIGRGRVRIMGEWRSGYDVNARGHDDVSSWIGSRTGVRLNQSPQILPVMGSGRRQACASMTLPGASKISTRVLLNRSGYLQWESSLVVLVRVPTP